MQLVSTQKRKMIRVTAFEKKSDIDFEHCIEVEGTDAKIYFLKESEGKALRNAQLLLMDSFEQRIKKVS